MITVDRPAWMADTPCGQTNPDAFFPTTNESHAAAKAVCASCDVTSQCLDYALANDEEYGIWGGLSTNQRRRVAKQLAETGQIARKVCALEDCDAHVPLGAPPNQLYCCNRHAHRVAERRAYAKKKGAAA